MDGLLEQVEDPSRLSAFVRVAPYADMTEKSPHAADSPEKELQICEVTELEAVAIDHGCGLVPEALTDTE